MSVHRGVVSAVGPSGLFVRVAGFGPSALPASLVGPLPSVGASVLVANAGDEGAPDLVVLTSGDGLPVTWKGGNVSAWNFGAFADIPGILAEVEALALNVVTVPVRVTATSTTDSSPVVDSAHLAHALAVAAALPAHVKVVAEPYPFIAGGAASETAWNPSNVTTWFAAWSAACVTVAQAFPQAAMVYVGSNLAMLECAHDAQWSALVSAVRAVTRAEVSYRCNWWYSGARRDALAAWSFLSEVDVVSVGAYFELTDSVAPGADEVRACLDGSLIYDRGQDVVSDVRALHEAHDRPVFFGELNCSHFQGALGAPWNPTPSAVRDRMVQSRMFRAYVAAFGAFGWWRGFSVFNIGDFDDSGYVLESPARRFIRSIPVRG